MKADELRLTAANFREIAQSQVEAHIRSAKLLAGTLTPEDRIAMKALAGVQDCMTRRYRMWADHIDAAANEIDELGNAAGPS